MCSELTSRTRKAFTEWSNRQFACFDPYLTRCRCQTTNMVPQTLSQHGLPASFYLYSWRPVRLGWKALMMHLHCQIDGDVQPHDHEKLEKKQTCASLASLSMLSLIHCCCIFLQCALGLFDFHIHHTVPTHAATFPMTHKSPYPYRNCKELHFLVILLLNSHNLSTPTIYCLHSSMHRPHTVRARALCFL